jgi:hypothetical protein
MLHLVGDGTGPVTVSVMDLRGSLVASHTVTGPGKRRSAPPATGGCLIVRAEQTGRVNLSEKVLLLGR